MRCMPWKRTYSNTIRLLPLWFLLVLDSKEPQHHLEEGITMRLDIYLPLLPIGSLQSVCTPQLEPPGGQALLLALSSFW